MTQKTLNALMREAIVAALERALIVIVENGKEMHLLDRITITETGHGFKVSIFAAGEGREEIIDIDQGFALADDETGAVG
jgi:alcohol dehydrogenase class IV